MATNTWSIRGVDTSTRTNVASAARKKGVTIGQFINTTLLSASNKVLLPEEYPLENRELLNTINGNIGKLAKYVVQITTEIQKLKEEQNNNSAPLDLSNLTNSLTKSLQLQTKQIEAIRKEFSQHHQSTVKPTEKKPFWAIFKRSKANGV